MKKILFLSFILFFGNLVYSQDYSNGRQKFTFKQTVYELIEYENKNNDFEICLLISKSNETADTVHINANIHDMEFLSFGEYVDLDKKYILLTARYSFWILNLYNNKLSKAYSPNFYGMGSDSQSSMLSNVSVILDGRCVIGYCVDSGCFLYDLSNIYSPKEIQPANNPIYHENRVILLPQFKNKGKFTAIFLYTESWNADYKIIFINKTVEQEDFSYLTNLSEEQIEELAINEYPVTASYTILKETELDNKSKYIVIENDTGKIISLPAKIEINRQEIIKYLENL